MIKNTYHIPLLLMVFILSMWTHACFSEVTGLSDDNQSESSQRINFDQAEAKLLEIIDLINKQQLDDALSLVESLLQQYPNFELARAVRDDLVFSRFNTLDKPFALSKNNEVRKKYLSEAHARIDGASKVKELAEHKIPAVVKYIDEKVKYFFVIDFFHSRLYLFHHQNGKMPQLITDHYVTSGKGGYKKESRGDEKTPLGVYYITTFLEDKKLPELYGWGAFPINYPNSWDKQQGRTGSGIWLHGVPRSTYSRPPLDSRGCLVVSNDFLFNISSYLKTGTPVVLADQVNWIDEQQYFENRTFYFNLLQQWRLAWESKDINRYLEFYSKKFNNNKKDYHAWAKHKRQVFKYTKKIKVAISDLKIFAYPGEKDMLSVHFYQHYDGGHFKARSYKQQYWKKEADGKWRIIYEYKR